MFNNILNLAFVVGMGHVRVRLSESDVLDANRLFGSFPSYGFLRELKAASDRVIALLPVREGWVRALLVAVSICKLCSLVVHTLCSSLSCFFTLLGDHPSQILHEEFELHDLFINTFLRLGFITHHPNISKKLSFGHVEGGRLGLPCGLIYVTAPKMGL